MHIVRNITPSFGLFHLSAFTFSLQTAQSEPTISKGVAGAIIKAITASDTDPKAE